MGTLRTFSVVGLTALWGALAGGAGGVEVDEEDIFPGDPIVITAIGEPARESEVPFGITAVTAAELELLAAENLAEGLVRAEGVYVREYGGPGANKTLSMRGGFANQTLVMVDGQPINNHQGGDVDFNAVALEDVERVEVMAGPSSALYGANATAGVVNVITRGIPDEPGVTFRGEYGTYNGVGAAVEAGVPFGRIGITGGGNYCSSDGFRENDDYEGEGGHLKLSYAATEEATLSARGQYQTSALGVPGSLSYPTPGARQEDDFVSVNVGLDGTLGEGWSTEGRVYTKNQKRHYVDPAPLVPVDDTHRNNAVGGRGVVFRQIASWNRGALGGELEREATDSTAIGKRAGTTWAAFGQEDLRFDKLTTVFGVRYDSSGIYGEAVSPRLGVRYRFNDYASARASGGRGFRAPTFDELFWPDTGYGGGNPDLRPEYCWSYEAGPTLRWGSHLKIEAIYFYSNYDDLISGWPPDNVARAFIRGGEVGFRTTPVPSLRRLHIDATATFLQTKDRETGEQLDYRPVHTEFAEVRYRHDFGGGAFALTPSVSTEIVGRQQYTDYDPVTFAPFKAWLDAYALLNARLAFKAYYAEFYVAGKNLTGETYQTIYDYPMPGRTLFGGVNVTF
jgi:outer membrane cobalamin receptor